jgi:hypothetical protein
MLHEEARWWRQVMDAIQPSLLYPMLNVGSSTEHFRTVQQPFIDIYLFHPAREKGQRVVHLDTKQDVGVNLVGDITEDSFREKLVKMSFNSVFCSHLLEHVDQDTRKPICAAIAHLLPRGGYVFVSCPRRYPYHPDPIDTGFRPTTADLAALFPGMTVIVSQEVFGETYFRQLWRRHDRGAKELAKLFLPFYKPHSWWVNVGYFAYLFRRFSSSCVVLRKEADA